MQFGNEKLTGGDSLKGNWGKEDDSFTRTFMDVILEISLREIHKKDLHVKVSWEK